MGQGDLGRSFAGEIDHSQLAGLDILVPVGEVDGDTMLAFTVQGLDSTTDVATFAYLPVDAEALESYTGANNVGAWNLSLQGMDNYTLGAVKEAVSMLPEEIFNGAVPEIKNMDAEQARALLIEGGLLEDFKNFRQDAFNSADGGTIDPNDPEHAAVLNRLDKVHAQLNVAATLPEIANDIQSRLDEAQELGVSSAQIDGLKKVLDGEELSVPDVKNEAVPD